MAFTVQDLDQLLRLLPSDEQRLDQLRRLLVGEQAITARLDRVEERLDRIEGHLQQLAAAQVRTEQRIDELAAAQARTEQGLRELAAAQARTEQRIDELAAAQARTEQGLRELAVAQARTETSLASVRGLTLEQKYERRAPGYFGRWLRRVRACDRVDLEARLEQHLSPDEITEVQLLDLVLVGRLPGGTEEVHLAVEVSVVVDRNDVTRAASRAALLRRAGLRAVAVVAGEGLTEGAGEEAARRRVAVLHDGRGSGWEQALAEAS